MPRSRPQTLSEVAFHSCALSLSESELPEAAKRQLGLDMSRQWIVFDEISRFVWPRYDLRKVPRTGADSYGVLSEPLFQEMLNEVLARHRARKNAILDRSSGALHKEDCDMTTSLPGHAVR